MEPIESFTMDEGLDPYGTHKQVTFEGDQGVTKLTTDVSQILERTRAERIVSAGERWGDGRKVGELPMSVYTAYSHIKDREERQKFLLNWLRENPAFVSFERFLK